MKLLRDGEEFPWKTTVQKKEKCNAEQHYTKTRGWIVTFQNVRIAFSIVCDGKFWLADIDSLKISQVKYKVVVVLNPNRKTGASGGAVLRILSLDTR